MKYTNVRWEYVQNYPVLKVNIDGQEAVIPWEQKTSLIIHGFVFIGDEFKGEEYTFNFRDTELSGFTRDKDFLRDVFMPFAKAVRDGTFEEKSIELG